MYLNQQHHHAQGSLGNVAAAAMLSAQRADLHFDFHPALMRDTRTKFHVEVVCKPLEKKTETDRNAHATRSVLTVHTCDALLRVKKRTSTYLSYDALHRTASHNMQAVRMGHGQLKQTTSCRELVKVDACVGRGGQGRWFDAIHPLVVVSILFQHTP